MEINLFSWIREGVKQAVLHGVSDAVGEIGPAGENDDMPQRLLSAIKQNPAPMTGRVEGSTTKPKRLGRSLEQIAADKDK